MSKEIINAVIKKVEIGFEKGNLVWWIFFDHEKGSQGFGGIRLKAEHIEKILRVAESQTWEALVGKPCRIDWTSTNIRGIGHFIKKDKWFRPMDNSENEDSKDE
jgi:hypothetical protein